MQVVFHCGTKYQEECLKLHFSNEEWIRKHKVCFRVWKQEAFCSRYFYRLKYCLSLTVFEIYLKNKRTREKYNSDNEDFRLTDSDPRDDPNPTLYRWGHRCSEISFLSKVRVFCPNHLVDLGGFTANFYCFVDRFETIHCEILILGCICFVSQHTVNCNLVHCMRRRVLRGGQGKSIKI